MEEWRAGSSDFRDRIQLVERMARMGLIEVREDELLVMGTTGHVA